MSNVAIVGSYAVAYGNSEGDANIQVGMVILATDASGAWATVCADHGSLAVVDMLGCAPKMGLPTADALFNQVQVESP